MLKRLFTDSLTHGAADVLVRAIGPILIPIYTRLLAPEEFGLVEMNMWLSQRAYPVPHDWSRIIGGVAVGVVIYGVVALAGIEGTAERLLALMISVVAVVIIGLVRARELARIFDSLRDVSSGRTI